MTVVTQSRKLIFYINYNIIEQSYRKCTCLKRKLRIQCPCGYVFDVLSTEKEALVRIRLHFERFHKDFLPFGITDAEALAFLKKGLWQGKNLVCSNNVCQMKENRRIPQQIV